MGDRGSAISEQGAGRGQGLRTFQPQRQADDIVGNAMVVPDVGHRGIQFSRYGVEGGSFEGLFHSTDKGIEVLCAGRFFQQPRAHADALRAPLRHVAASDALAEDFFEERGVPEAGVGQELSGAVRMAGDQGFHRPPELQWNEWVVCKFAAACEALDEMTVTQALGGGGELGNHFRVAGLAGQLVEDGAKVDSLVSSHANYPALNVRIGNTENHGKEPGHAGGITLRRIQSLNNPQGLQRPLIAFLRISRISGEGVHEQMPDGIIIALDKEASGMATCPLIAFEEHLHQIYR